MVKFTDPELDTVFHALSDRTRRQIVLDANKSPKTAGELAAPHSISLPAISKHLKILEKTDLLSRERVGKTHVFRTKTDTLTAAQDTLNELTNFWNNRLNELEDFVTSSTNEQARFTPLYTEKQ